MARECNYNAAAVTARLSCKKLRCAFLGGSFLLAIRGVIVPVGVLGDVVIRESISVILA